MGTSVLAVPAHADAVVARPGSPLEPGVRESMQERMGYDFARVRVHADTSAARSARALGALAYTVGEHIVFDTGRYAPGTDAGQRLLAHELTHVTQQHPGLLRQLAGSDVTTEDPLEREARAVAQAVGGKPEAAFRYPDEPGLDGELPHPSPVELAAIVGSARRAPARHRRSQVKESTKRIVIDLDKQTATAMEDGKPVRTMPISSGKAGHRTTKGSNFTISDRKVDATSSIYGKCVGQGHSRDVSHGAGACRKGEVYHGAPMPYFQRFNGAEGLHQGKLPGYPDSHGCVRLSGPNAKWLWGWAGKGTKVDVGPP